MIGEYDIEAVRAEWLGKIVSQTTGRYVVEHDPIRRHCHMVGDLNPLFLDPASAAQGPFGGVIAPPTMASLFASRGTWPPANGADQAPAYKSFSHGVPTPGDRGINMGVKWTFLGPAYVGDHLKEKTTIVDIFIKPIKLDPMAVWIVTEHRMTNQDGKDVAIRENTVLVHRAPEAQ